MDGQNGGGLFANVDVPSRGRIRRGKCHGGQKGSKGGVWTSGAQLNKFRGARSAIYEFVDLSDTP